MILVDTNILVDLIVASEWTEWSRRELANAQARDQVAINMVIYTELAAGFESHGALDEMLAATEVDLAAIPRAALFRAGKAFRRYRTAGGIRTGVLPDFFIGAHAEATGSLLLTRDMRRYRTYFPQVSLIVPDVN